MSFDSRDAARRAFIVRKAITKGVNEMMVSREDGQHVLRSCEDQMAQGRRHVPCQVPHILSH